MSSFRRVGRQKESSLGLKLLFISSSFARSFVNFIILLPFLRISLETEIQLELFMFKIHQQKFISNYRKTINCKLENLTCHNEA